MFSSRCPNFSLFAFWEGLRLVALALYAYFLRPLMSAWAGADGNDPGLRILSPSWLSTLLTDRVFGWKHLAAHDALAEAPLLPELDGGNALLLRPFVDRLGQTI